MIEILACDARAYIKDGRHHLDFTIPQTHIDFLCTLAEGVKTRRCNQLYLKVGLPRKPVSTGKHSQMSRIHGNCDCLSKQLSTEGKSFTMEQVKEAMKRMAVSLGYPTELNDIDGVEEPLHLNDPRLTSSDAQKVTETIQHFADEHDFYLIEYYGKPPKPYKSLYGMSKEEMEKHHAEIV